MKKHWYKLYYEECPVCGRSDNWRERVYGRKPKKPSLRIFYKQAYCYCESHL